MATFESVKSGTLNTLVNTVTSNVDTLSTISRGVMLDLLTVSLEEFKSFNALNHRYMDYHMIRNIYEKEFTLNSLGANAYLDGDSDNLATPAQFPTYTKGLNYTEFLSNVRNAEKRGQLTTRIATLDSSNLFNSQNLYLDSDYGFGDTTATRGGNPLEDGLVQFTGDSTDRNSILYKTKKLIRENKLKTIISQFHTDPSVKYNGQIGNPNFGESHGRNLVTKQAEGGKAGYTINGFDNPYCRVWTHHYQYDRLAKTMRAKSSGLNNWAGFEWNDKDKGHGKDNTKYGDGESKYDYAWRGKHNQDRIAANTVLDRETGLVKITPQYRGGGESNRHTKECMFSIENLAWKDYDPYSFEQALSWEQRGPLGGRIMWFPPYGIEIQENATARWQQNDFIGRGESVYTYVNSERTGSLSFLMLTDHPSTIDYASWWDDNAMIKGLNDGDTNSENDYLRYFAGCANNDNGEIKKTKSPNDNKTGGLIVKPTPLTDEFIRLNPPVIKAKEKEPTPDTIPVNTPNTEVPPTTKNEKIGFFIFYPNNYSGVHDKPTNQNSDVNAIAYLLGGGDTQKQDQQDLKFDIGSIGFIDKDNGATRGYEMGKGAISTGYAEDLGTYIQGGYKKKTTNYEPQYKDKNVDNKIWEYRIDHKLIDKSTKIKMYKGTPDEKEVTVYYSGEDTADNTLNQDLKYKEGPNKGKLNPDNYRDKESYGYNLAINEKFKEIAATIKVKSEGDKFLYDTVTSDGVRLYSFAEFAAAIYKDDTNGNGLYEYLLTQGVNENRVDELIEIIKDKENHPFASGTCNGYASSQGYSSFNEVLAKNRANTIINWLSDKWKIKLGETRQLEVPNDDINDPQAKIARSAYCILEFSTSSTKPATQTNTTPEMVNVESEGEGSEETEQKPLYECKEYVGFKHVDTKTQPDGSIWNYYEKDGTVTYYEQQAGSQDNYDNPSPEDVVVTEQQVIDIFTSLAPKRVDYIETNPNYHKGYNDRGYYFTDPRDNRNNFVVYDFVEDRLYNPGNYIEHEGRVYVTINSHTGEWIDEDFIDLTKLRMSYDVGDVVKYEDKYYRCKVSFLEKYPDYDLVDSNWDEINDENITEYLNNGYRYRTSMPEGGYHRDDVIFDSENCVFKICTGFNKNNPKPIFISSSDTDWEKLTNVPVLDSTNYAWDDTWDTGTYIVYNGNVYKLKESRGHDPQYELTFNPLYWDLIDVPEYDRNRDYREGDMVWGTSDFDLILFKATKDIINTAWSDNLTKAIKNIIYDAKDNPTGEFDGEYPYLKGGVCRRDGTYYVANTDIADQPLRRIEFSLDDWEDAHTGDLYKFEFGWETYALAEKAAAVLCWTVDKMMNAITDNSEYTVNKSNGDYSCIWKYGTTNNFVNPEIVTTSTNLANYIDECELNSRDSSNKDARIRFTTDEQNYLGVIIDSEGTTLDIEGLRKYIVAYRLLDGITFIENDKGQRKVCDKAPKNTEEMNAKIERKDESETEGCEDKRWVDRGDGLLIQVCNIGKEGTSQARFNAETGEGDWNKLRYDQEYHFYKQYMIDHPLVFDKLQEKIKYFNPAFHSMTPEGFNARLTFLQQCTRQGNTKTMSDIGGKTANNLAFGRPPYCVLRLGDFYNQLIVIDNISFDYSASNGLQWDLNTEGNGVQPMLCRVSINFKFIGGGDITGPVQRLQNAMSFNYYANTSFYDNRADRPQYQDTNWETMGGAGNNKLDYAKSYAYVAKQYEDLESNITTAVEPKQ